MSKYNKYIILLILIIYNLGFSTSIFSQETEDKTPLINKTNKLRRINLNEKELAWLKKHPLIRVAADPNWAPYEFRDSKGKYKGMITDYLKYIENNLNIKFEYAQDETWKEMYEKTKNKKLDLISNVTKTPERSLSFNFTKPYIISPVYIFALKGSKHIRDLSELAGKKVAVVKGYITEENIKSDYPDLNIIPVKNIQEGLQHLDNKEVSAFVGGMVPVSYYSYEEGYNSIRIVGETPYSYNLSMGVRKDWPIFANILQKALDSMTESEKNNIYNNWITLKTKKFDYSILWKIMIPFSIIILIILYWNRKLSSEVQKRKLAQQKLNNAFKKLQDTQTHLVQTEKMASIGLLTAGIAHEIKNPLNFISLGINGVKEGIESIIIIAGKFEQIISKDIKSKIEEINKLKEDLEYDYFKEECSVLISHIQEGVERINEITKSLNTFSRTAGDEKIKADINEGIKSTLVLLRNQYKYSIEVIPELGEIPLINCSLGKLNQVFVNLIANAIQAIDDKGTIWIRTYREDNNINISIKDNGSGINKEKIENIFNPFFTTKPIGEGTGLGLAISKNIIEEHKGKIEVYTEKDVGTEFIISLPIM